MMNEWNLSVVPVSLFRDNKGGQEQFPGEGVCKTLLLQLLLSIKNLTFGELSAMDSLRICLTKKVFTFESGHCNSLSNLSQEIQIPGGSNLMHAYSNHICKWLYCDTQHTAHTNAVSERSTQGECSQTWALVLHLTRSCPMSSNISQSPCSSESQISLEPNSKSHARTVYKSLRQNVVNKWSTCGQQVINA